MTVSSILFNIAGISEDTINVIKSISATHLIIENSKDNMKSALEQCNAFAADCDNNILLISCNIRDVKLIQELNNILDISERHAAVSPRCQNIGLLAIPPYGGVSSKHNIPDSRKTFEAISEHLPKYQTSPYLSSACILLRGNIIKKFGFLNTSAKTLEEAVVDWCLVMGRVGYSSIAANKVFLDNTLPSNIDVLQHKQDYAHQLVDKYLRFGISAADRFANEIANHEKPKILLCMYQLNPVYNGTAEHSFSVARRLAAFYSDKYEFHLLINPENAKFFDVRKDFKIIVHPEHISDTYHLGITFTQVYHMGLLTLLNFHCLKIVTSVLDLISYRCSKLIIDTDINAFKGSIWFSDGIITISNTIKRDLVAALGMQYPDVEAKTRAILIASSDGDKHSKNNILAVPFKKFILVFGNHFEHKLLVKILPYLAKIERNFVIVGFNSNEKYRNIRMFPSGKLSYEFVDTLYKDCEALLFPSEYEGYGLPVIKAIEKGKRVIVSNTEINRELRAEFFNHSDNFIFFNTFVEMMEILKNNEFTTDALPAPMERTYDDTARETEAFIAEILRKPVNFEALSLRNEVCSMSAYNDLDSRVAIKLFIRKKYPHLFSLLKSLKTLLKIKLK